ncbi:MAG: hypothetical protein ACQERG_05770 [Pseudomonadota bacterium]
MMNRPGIDGGLRPWLLVAAVTLLPPSTAVALETGWELGVIHEYSDNIRRAPEGQEESDVIRTGRLGASLIADRSDLEGEAQVRVDFIDYLDETFDPEVRGQGSADLTWHIAPERFSWQVEERLAVIEEQSTDPLSPDNRQQINVFSTGPDYRLRLGGTRFLDAGARYTDIRYSRSNTDNRRVGGQLQLGWRPRATLESRLILDAIRVHYPLQAGTRDYDRQDLYGRVLLEGATTRTVADLGVTAIQRSAGDDVAGGLARLGWEREMSTATRVRLGLAGEYTDTASDLLGRPGEPVRDPSAVDSSADIFFARRAEVGFRRETPRGSLALDLRAEDRTYEEAPLDQQRGEASVNLGVVAGPRSRVELFGYQAVYDYDASDRLDTDREGGLRLRIRLRQALELRLQGSRAERETSGATGEYQEDSVLLELSYRG